ncbi:LA_0442/LA_0875 N-terminal domain-containing protein [Leptospira mayottensis]|uniref:LA_0442/LA_0875 N-terminal domain-containing protein n=1 Tax=Leptospira mayottensis TaxID=1137606 RepID=UPI000E35CD55|nr:DNA-binding protein [Leptospira mayottensis]AXR67051.1 DNA-binding protein [Leptospira mayottensis]
MPTINQKFLRFNLKFNSSITRITDRFVEFNESLPKLNGISLYILLFVSVCFFTNLDAKSILLKNGKRIVNVKIKIVPNGFEITHKNGKIEKISLTEVQKVFISNYPPNEAKKPETLKTPLNLEANQEQIAPLRQTETPEAAKTVPKLEANLDERVPSAKKSGIKIFAEGLIPGWSRLLRNDSYSLKGLGFLLILAELYLAERSYLYLSPVKPALKTNNPPTPFELIAIASNDQNLINIAAPYSIVSNSSKVVLMDGQLMEKSRYAYEKQAYVSAFVFVLILDAFLGYTFENWEVVPSVNVSFRDQEIKEISGGVVFRF